MMHKPRLDIGERAALRADLLPGHRVRLGQDRPLKLDCGAELRDFPVAYQMYGQLNADSANEAE